MTDAINQPVRRRREVNTADMQLGQPGAMQFDGDENPIRENVVEAVPADIEADYIDSLKFNEDPVTILIHPPQSKNPPLVVDCWVQGKGAEVFVNGKWHVFGCLPIGMEVVTKRKYVEVLARSKTENIQADFEMRDNEDPRQRLVRLNSSNHLFTVIEDRNPAGRRWLSALMAEKY